MTGYLNIEKITEDIALWREDMNFMFEWQEYKTHIFKLTCNVLLLYEHTDDGVVDDFLKIFNHFLKIYKDFPKLFRKTDERSRTFSQNF